MSKPQEGAPLRDRLVALRRSLALTHQEKAMVAVILLSLLVGALVRHYRREYRLDHPALAAPSPSHGPEIFGGD